MSDYTYCDRCGRPAGRGSVVVKDEEFGTYKQFDLCVLCYKWLYVFLENVSGIPVAPDCKEAEQTEATAE